MADISSLNGYNIKDATARAGVTATVDLMKDTTGWLGKNLIKCDIDSLKADNTTGTWSGNVYTLMGVTYTPTFTEDGYLKTVIVNGENSSSSNNSDFQINRRYYNSDNLGKATILNGCPNTIGNKGRIGFRVGNKTSGTFITVYEDKGSGVNIPVLGSNEDGGINITIFPQQSVSNLEFYPMLRDASILDQTFEPYHKSVEDWYWSENAKLGAHQLIPLTLVDLKAKNTTGTWTNNVYEINNVTLTCEVTDGYITKITANGTPNANVWFLMNIWSNGTFDKGSYELLGCPTGGSSNSYQILFREDPQVTGGVFVANYGTPVPFTISDSSKKYAIFIGLLSGTPLSNKVFTPLIRYAGDTSSECTPFAMTNRELTEKVQEINSSVSLLDSPAEVGSTGMISIPISDIMQYSDIVVVGYNGSDGGGNRFVAVIPTEIDGQFDVGIPFVVKSSTGVGFIVARIASNVLSLTFLDNANTNITTMYVKKIYGRKR